MEGIIFIGLQASGKSSFFLESFCETHIKLSMDMLKTRHRESILLNACIEGKQKLVIDNTNPSINERRKYIEAMKQGGFKVKGYYFESKIQDCLKRNSERNGKAKIPEIGIKGTFNKLEIPSYKEGFDELFYVSLSNNKFNISQWKNEVQ
jgi:predicted kinase